MTASDTHPLIDELRSDLEVAFDHFKRVTGQLSRAKRGKADGNAIVLKRSELSVCFDVLNSASERFNLLNDLYATVVAAPDEETALAALVSQLQSLEVDSTENRALASDFVSGLNGFLMGNDLSENNRKFRRAWQSLELEMVAQPPMPEEQLRAAWS